MRSPSAGPTSAAAAGGRARASSCTPNTSVATASAAGTAESAKTVRRSLTKRSAAEASSGPIMAPVWSMARWKPKARPRSAGGVTCATRASRGALRTPFPTRSLSRTTRTCQGAPANATSGRASEDSV